MSIARKHPEGFEDARKFFGFDGYEYNVGGRTQVRFFNDYAERRLVEVAEMCNLLDDKCGKLAELDLSIKTLMVQPNVDANAKRMEQYLEAMKGEAIDSLTGGKCTNPIQNKIEGEEYVGEWNLKFTSYWRKQFRQVIDVMFMRWKPDESRHGYLELTLYHDFAPLSFEFTLERYDKFRKEKVPCMHGGIIWHGPSKNDLIARVNDLELSGRTPDAEEVQQFIWASHT